MPNEKSNTGIAFNPALAVRWPKRMMWQVK